MLNSNLCLSQRLTVSVDEAMTALGVGKTMMYELLNDGSIRSFKKGEKAVHICAITARMGIEKTQKKALAKEDL